MKGALGDWGWGWNAGDDSEDDLEDDLEDGFLVRDFEGVCDAGAASFRGWRPSWWKVVAWRLLT